MSADIINFPGGKSMPPGVAAATALPVDMEVVRMLEIQLALAKEGRVKFVALAAVSSDNIGYSAWAPDSEMPQDLCTTALGSITFLHARFNESVLHGVAISEHDDSEDDPEPA